MSGDREVAIVAVVPARRTILDGHSPAGRGRSCPLSYRYRPEDLAADPAAIECSTLYVIGGLYGNSGALRAALTRVSEDGDPDPAVVFNGDFHYLDVSPKEFQTVAELVGEHRATQGNIEAELASPDRDAGCGCDYPDYIDDRVVGRSNAIVDRLHHTAEAFADHVTTLSRLPRFLTVEVAGHRVGVVHGDAHSLAGWGFALEALEPEDSVVRQHVGWSGTPTTAADVAQWFQRAQVRVFASTHTGLPFAQDFSVDGSKHLLINNGTAGMGNFQSSVFGVLTRVSAQRAAPADSLYGMTIEGLRCDALPIEYDIDDWSAVFLNSWPPETPAHTSYWERIVQGTFLQLEQSARGSVRR